MPGWTFTQWIIAIIIVAACIGILLVVLPLLGVVIPGWAMQIFWICLVAVVAIVAIRFLISLWSGWGKGPGP